MVVSLFRVHLRPLSGEKINTVSGTHNDYFGPHSAVPVPVLQGRHYRFARIIRDLLRVRLGR